MVNLIAALFISIVPVNSTVPTPTPITASMVAPLPRPIHVKPHHVRQHPSIRIVPVKSAAPAPRSPNAPWYAVARRSAR